MFELDPRLAFVAAVDREPDGSNTAWLDDALGRLALVRCYPLLPGRRDLVQHDARSVRDHRHGRAPREHQDVPVLQQRLELRRLADSHLTLVVALIVRVVQQFGRADLAYLRAQA